MVIGVCGGMEEDVGKGEENNIVITSREIYRDITNDNIVIDL